MPTTAPLLDLNDPDADTAAADLDTLRAELIAAHTTFTAARDRARELNDRHKAARQRPRELAAALVVARRAEADALEAYIGGPGSADAHLKASTEVERLEAEKIALAKLLRALDGPGGQRNDPFRVVEPLHAEVKDAKARLGAAVVGTVVDTPDLRRRLLESFAVWSWSRGFPVSTFTSTSAAGSAFEDFLTDLIERPNRAELAAAANDAERWLEGLPS